MSETLLPLGSVVGNFLLTTYDEHRHEKLELSDYYDDWKM